MLDQQMRGILDQIIDQMVSNLSIKLSSLRDGEAKVLQVKNHEDYALGFAHGAIRGTFQSTFIALRGRPTNDEEETEALMVLYNRTKELREAIFRGG